MARNPKRPSTAQADSSDDDNCHQSDEYDSDMEISKETRKRKNPPKRSKSTTVRAKAAADSNDDSDGEDDGEMDELVAEDDEDAILECGHIRKIYLENFMNHKKFSMDFGNHLNFIGGRNGSGKSAIAVAIQLCLGGKTGSTGRGKKLSTMIRDGSDNPAIIRITLRNEGCDAYEPNTYGARVIVERTIHKNSTSSYKLMDANNKTISTSKKELERIMLCFNIWVENPCCVLTQEESKKFIGGSIEEKYNFFLKATGLLSLGDEVLRQKEDLAVAKASQAKTIGTLEKKHKQAERWRKILVQFQEFAGLDDTINECYAKAAWCDCREERKTVDSAAKTIEAAKIEVDNLSKELEALNTTQTDSTGELHDLTARSDGLQQLMESATLEKDTIVNAMKEVQKIIEGFKRTKVTAADAIKTNKHQLAYAEKKLQEDKTAAMKHADSEERELLEGINAADEEIKQCANREQDIRAERGTLVSRKMEATRDVNSYDATIRTLQNQKESIENELRHCTGAGGESEEIKNLRRFGEKHVSVFKEIQKARFHYEVVGPVGNYVKMKDGCNRYDKAVERCLGSTLQNYIVSSPEDQATLRDIMRKCQANFAINYQSRENRNYSQYRASQNIGNGVSVESCVKVENQGVMMLLYDQASFDRVVMPMNNKDMYDSLISGGRGGEGFVGDIASAILVQENCDLITYRLGNQAHEANRYPFRGLLVADQGDNIQRLQAQLTDIEQQLQEAHQQVGEARQQLRQIDNDMAAIDSNYKQTTQRGKEIIRRKSQLQEKLKDVQAADKYDPTLQEDEIAELRETIDQGSQAMELITQNLELENNKQKAVKAEKKKAEDKLNELCDESSELERKVQEIVGRQHNDKKMKERAEKQLRDKERLYDGLVVNFHKLTEKFNKIEEAAQAITQDKLGSAWDGNPLPLTRKDTRQTLERTINDKTREKEIGLRSKNLAGLNMETASENMEKARNDYKKSKREHKIRDENIADMDADVKIRSKKWRNLLREGSERTSKRFDQYCRKSGKTGEVKFDHIEKTMVIMAQMDSNAQNQGLAPVEVKNLSGGERSFVTFALLLALGHSIETPFRIMDEYDVYMDETTRKKTLEELVKYTTLPEFRGRQFLAITPQNLNDVCTSNSVRIARMPDVRKVGQTSHGLQQQTMNM